VSTDSLLAVSIGINIGLAIAVMLLGVALLVVVTRSREKDHAIEDLRQEVTGLAVHAESLAVAVDTMTAEVRLLRSQVERGDH
jgi:energy-coupling factor transporter transmembrane protein EcfT